MKKGIRKKVSQVKEEPKLTLDDVRERLWRAIPCVAQALQAETDAVKGEEKGKSPETQQSSDFVNDLTLPCETMQHIVRCLCMATHGNPTPEDVDEAVDLVFGGSPMTQQECYSKKDLYYFLDSIPNLWLSHAPFTTEDALVQLNLSLVECIITDEPLVMLIDDPQKALLLSRSICTLRMLTTPVVSFVPLTTHPPHKEIFCTLWAHIQSASSEETTQSSTEHPDALTSSQFRVFFAWFIRLHFSNMSARRLEVAARNIWLEFLNEKAEMDSESFKRVCGFMCRHYAQQLNTTAYLEKLLGMTQAQLTIEGKGDQNPLVVPSLEEVQTDQPRRRLEDPTLLYMPEELRRWRHEGIFYNRGPSENRILIHGPRFLGKTTIGKALAETLHAVHLDVLELATKATANASNGDELGQQLLELVEHSVPIPLPLQAALIRREVVSRGAYEGYVFSDSLSLTEGNRGAVAQFLEDCGLARISIPSIFLELSSADTEWVQEVQKTVSTSRRSTDEALLASYTIKQERLQREREIAELLASREETLTRLAQLQNNKNATEEELSKARKMVAEAEALLASLPHEEQDESSSHTPEDPRLLGGEADNETTEDAQYHQWMLGRLIESGRASLLDGNPSEASLDEASRPPLTSLPALTLAVERAALRDAILTVDATSSVSDIVSYLTHSLSLTPTLLVREVDVGGAHEETPVETLEDEKALAQVKEEAALASGCQYSPTWKRYCPVTYEEDRVLIEGSPMFGCTLRSYLYTMTSRDKLEKFKRDPLFYLRRMPSSQEPILLVASADELRGERKADAKDLDLHSLIKRLAHSLQLTVTPLPEYASSHSQYRELRDKRGAVFLSRTDYDREERQQRATRLEKRLRLEAKKRRASGVRKPKMPKLSSDKDALSTGERHVTATRVTFRVSQQPKSIAKALDEEIKKIQENQKNNVPALMTALSPQDHDPAVLELLLKENTIPKKVLVLRRESFPVPPVWNDKSNSNDDDTLSKTDPEPLALSFCDEIVGKIREHEGGGDNDSTEPIRIHEINILGMSEQELLWDIWQRVSPAAVQATPGAVDENLGAEEDDEEEEFMEEEDEEEEEGSKELKSLLAVAKRIEPLLKPRRRFLHQFGSRLQYCPVTLHTKRLLVRGRNDLCLSFLGDLYCFATEECLSQFQQNPLRFVNDVPPRNTPLRLWLVGATFSGRQTLGAGIQREFGVPFFRYDTNFLESCIDAAVTPGGAKVGDIFIPEADLSQCPAAARGLETLQGLRDFASDHERRLKLRQEAEKELEKMDESAEEKEEDEEAIAREAELQGYLEFEPEEEESKQERLNEAHLRILSCLTRMEPFESQGYIMACSPFSDVDMDILFEESCIPEVVAYLEVPEDMYAQRVEKVIAQQQRDAVPHPDEAQIVQMGVHAKQQVEALEQKKRERLLQLWRRRHIGANDDPDETQLDYPVGDEALKGGARPQSGELQGGGPKGSSAWPSLSTEVEAVEQFLEILEDRFVDVVRVPGGAGPETVLRGGVELLQRHLCNRCSFFCAPQIVQYEFSQDLLKNGKATESCFGQTDLVELFERRMGMYQPCRNKPAGDCKWSAPECVSEMIARAGDDNTSSEGHTLPPDDAGDIDEEMTEYGSEELEEMRGLAELKRAQWNRLMAPHSVLFADRVYYFKRYSTLKKFLLNPILYVSQPPPLPRLRSMPAVTIFSGDVFESEYALSHDALKRRSLAESVAYNLNAVLISVPKLLSWAAVHPRLGSLSVQAIRAAFSGYTDYDTIERLFSLRLGGADVKWKGAIISDWPRDVSGVDRVANHPHPTTALMARAVCVEDASTSYLRGVQLLPLYAVVQQRLDELFLYVQDMSPPNPRDPKDPANLLKLVRDVEALVERGRNASLRRHLAFPVSVANLWSFREEVATHMSIYQWYCPYSWVEESDLVDTRFCEGLWAAQYLGEYYFFSSDDYLQRFLLDPHVVAESTTQRPLPCHLPTRILRTFSDAEASQLALQGCCPVLLYDTRDNNGLRGVKEATARLGALSCVVEYNGKHYACLDETNKERFLRRPWQYIDAAVPLPPSHKCPLFCVASKPQEEELRQSMDGKTYIKRYLYDQVAHAILSVAEVRPMYPGLSVEDSVLKYISLYLKAHREDANEQQRKQYVEKLDLFTKRSTLYKHIGDSPLRNLEKEESEIRELYVEYDMVQKGLENVSEMSHLKMHSDVKQ